jgi:hypothetical protein
MQMYLLAVKCAFLLKHLGGAVMVQDGAVDCDITHCKLQVLHGYWPVEL